MGDPVGILAQLCIIMWLGIYTYNEYMTSVSNLKFIYPHTSRPSLYNHPKTLQTNKPLQLKPSSVRDGELDPKLARN